MSKQQFSVLITGCSSGIGRAMALEMAARGHTVFATARKPETLKELEQHGIVGLKLDVTDARSISTAVNQALESAGRIDVLVNNAGFGLMGPAVELEIGAMRRQLETNVIGPLALVQAVVPGMIERGLGRIVNVGSVSGVLATPFSGAYCASKAALHALSDSLRMELAPFGVRVITLQPGAVASRFGENAAQQVDLRPDSYYAKLARFIQERANVSQSEAMPAEQFAAKVADAIESDDPPAVMVIGGAHTSLPLVKRLMPLALIDRMLSRRFGLNLLRPPRKE
ncbi:MAG: SDR family NAD(P)-dependent oxidoreductase [Candidatus Alcyoniella australis]|nr:SDR family NAD(P)-dependent oxidoreductase [Candidatus Alcyoniella australis]